MKELKRIFHLVLLLLCMGPGRAAAELPLLSLPSKGMYDWQTSLLAGTREVGLGTYLPFPCTPPTDGLALEARHVFQGDAISVDAAYRLQLTESTRSYASRGFSAAMQLGVHVHSATWRSDEAGLGPAVGFSLSQATARVPWHGYLEGFMGVQGASVLSPSSARLEVPVRASVGVQGKVGDVHLMLVARGGWDDLRLDMGKRTALDATLSVGFLHFE